MNKTKKAATSPRHFEEKAEQAENTEQKSVRSSKHTVSLPVASKELEEKLKRALADYHNLEKRIEEERKLLSKLSASLLIEKLLPILDNLEQAQSHFNDQGLEIVLKQFRDILQTEGVEEIPAVGVQFDPHLHEAVETQAGEQENRIARVLAKGYKIDNTVIRPAKVIVVKGAVEREDGSQPNRLLDP